MKDFRKFLKKSNFFRRLKNFFVQSIKAIIHKGDRMRCHPTSQGNRQEGVFVDATLLRGIIRVLQMERRVEAIPDELRSEALSLGRFFMDLDALEKIRADIRFAGLRYWVVSQLVRNYVQAQGAATGAGFSTLEIGCNMGLMSIMVKTNCPDLNVVALDRFERAVRLGKILERTIGASGVRWIVGDGFRLNEHVEGEAFDLVFLCEILEHFASRREQEALLTQAVKVCRPGGKVMVSVPFEDRLRMPEHPTEFDAAMLTDLLEPFTKKIFWLAEERVRYFLDNHFLLVFTPRTAVTESEF